MMAHRLLFVYLISVCLAGCSTTYRASEFEGKQIIPDKLIFKQTYAEYHIDTKAGVAVGVKKLDDSIFEGRFKSGRLISRKDGEVTSIKELSKLIGEYSRIQAGNYYIDLYPFEGVKSYLDGKRTEWGRFSSDGQLIDGYRRDGYTVRQLQVFQMESGSHIEMALNSKVLWSEMIKDYFSLGLKLSVEFMPASRAYQAGKLVVKYTPRLSWVFRFGN